MNIYIGSDHAGFALKKELIPYIQSFGFSVTDCGPEKYDHDDDYPDYISKVASKVSEEFVGNPLVRGIVIGYSGQGEAIVANRFPRVRAALYYGGPKHILTLSREHNNANILSLGAHFVTTQEAKEAVELWLHSDFSHEERHARRIMKIEHYS